MNPKTAAAPDSRNLLGERTSLTDDQRIRDITPLPPPLLSDQV